MFMLFTKKKACPELSSFCQNLYFVSKWELYVNVFVDVRVKFQMLPAYTVYRRKMFIYVIEQQDFFGGMNEPLGKLLASNYTMQQNGLKHWIALTPFV